MAFPQGVLARFVAETTTLALLGMAAILVGMLLVNQVLAKRAREQVAEPEDPAKDLLLKFAHHEGSVVGESVAIDDDRLILKQAGVFKSVPLAQAEVHEGDIRITGDVDWEEAIRQGEAWHDAKTAGHDPAITEQLTRSEDVRSPALSALRSQDEEE